MSLPDLQSITFSATTLVIEAMSGGRINLPQLQQITDAVGAAYVYTRITADGTNSLIDLSQLVGFYDNNNTVGYSSVLEAKNGGAILLNPLLQTRNVNIIINGVTNHSPLGKAGGPYKIEVGQSLTLDASQSTDPDQSSGDHIVAYQWDLNGDGLFWDASGTQPTVDWSTLSGLNLAYPTSPSTGLPFSTVGLRVMDSVGAISTTSTTLVIWDNHPTAAFTGSLPLPRPGQTVNFDARSSHPSRPDEMIARSDWDFGDGITTQGLQVAHAYATGGTYQVRLTVTDNHVPPRTDTFTRTVNVNGVPVANSQTVTAEEGRSTPITLTATDLGNDALLFTVLTWPAHGSLTGIVPNLEYTPEADYRGPDSFTFRASDWQGASNVATVDITVIASPTLQVTSLTPTATGFSATFNRSLATTDLNLYDAMNGTLGPADVTLVGANSGSVSGSLVLNGDQRVTFVRTGGPLAPDTYTLTIRSATNGFHDQAGQLLDGNGDGIPGDNSTTTWTVAPAPPNEVILSVPDFARGYGQAVNLPLTTDTGIPVTLSTGRNVSSVDFALRYDPALLLLTGFTTGIPGATVAYQVVSPGYAKFTVSSVTEFSAANGSIELGRIDAAIPADAPYAAKQVLDLTDVLVYDAQSGLPQPRPARDDDGVHVAAFVGDTSASWSYTGGDVTLLQRVIVASASGFPSYPLADPRIIADLNGDGVLSGADATLLQRVVVGFPVPTVPPIPAGLAPASSGGADPHVFIPTNFAAHAGRTVTVPVNLTVTDAAGITISSVDLVIGYDASKFAVGNFRLGSLLQGAGFGAPVVNTTTPGIIRCTMSTAGSTPWLATDTTGSLLAMDFSVLAGAAVGESRINLRADFFDGLATTTTNVSDGAVSELTLNPVPTNADTDPVDGVFTVTPPWHNSQIACDVDDSNGVSALDVLILINYINAHPDQISFPNEVAGPPYYDVNGDLSITSLDVLMVIDYINHQSAAVAEGEGSAAPASGLGAATVRSFAQPTGQVSVDVSTRAVITTGDASRIPVPVTLPPQFAEAAGRADDSVGGLWAEDQAVNESDAVLTQLDGVLTELAQDVMRGWRFPM
ncbi:MAG: PKD domain-containing protein [Planctomycetota bacterium]|nr:PKD domain-containing protein [Planctomycetota bacterium]